MKKAAQIHLIIIGLSFVAGLLQQALYSIQHLQGSEALVFGSYLIVIPIVSSVAFGPGLLAGYLFGSSPAYLAATAGFLAYLPFQYGAQGQLTFDIPTAAAYSLAFAIATTVAFLAGAQAASRCRRP